MAMIGLELGRERARWLAGEPRRGRWRVTAAETRPLPAEPEARAAVLADLLATHPLRGRLTVGLPLTVGHLRLVHFPPTTEDNLTRLARAEAETHFGLPPASFDLGWATVGPTNGDGQPLVAVGLARTEATRRLLAPLLELRQPPRAVSLEAIALANLLGPVVRGSGAPAAVVQLEAGGGSLLLLAADGTLRAVRALETGPAGVWPELFRLVQSQPDLPAPATVWLAGAQAAEVAAAAPAEAPPAQLVDPWAILGCEPPDAAPPAEWAVAAGLLVQGGEVALPLDLLRRAPTAAETQRKRTAPLAWGLGLAFLALLVAVGLFIGSYRARIQRVAELEARVAALEAQLAEAPGEPTEFLDLLESTRDQVRFDSGWLELWRQLAEELPAGLALEQISGDAARGVTITGQAQGPGAVTALMGVLNQSGRFEPARLDRYDALAAGERPLYNYQVSASALGTAPRGGAR